MNDLRYYIDLIERVGQNVLFHGSPLEHVLNILRYDELETGEDYPSRGSANSFSRDYSVAKRFLEARSLPGNRYGGVIVFDRDKLARDYRIEPFADDDRYHVKYGNSPHAYRDEAEEIIRVDVSPVLPYIISVNVPEHMMEAALMDEEWRSRVPGEVGFDNAEDVRRSLLALKESPLYNRWKPLVGESLMEKVVYRDHEFVIVQNPSFEQTARMEEQSRDKVLRGLLTDDSLYVWDAYYANHDEVEKMLGLYSGYNIEIIDRHVRYDVSFTYGVDVSSDEEVEERCKEIEVELRGKPLLARAMGSDFEVEIRAV